MMRDEITPERIVATARGLDQPEFTRAELADKLGVSMKDLKGAVKAARQSGRVEKVRDDDDGKGVFRLTGE
jgi:DNA-binding MarR family transcriptional regulator